MPTDTESVVWYLVRERDDRVITESGDIMECIDEREEINTDTRITDRDPR